MKRWLLILTVFLGGHAVEAKTKSGAEVLQALVKTKPYSFESFEKIVGPMKRDLRGFGEPLSPDVNAPMPEDTKLQRDKFSSAISKVRVEFLEVDHHHEDPFTTPPYNLKSYTLTLARVTPNDAKQLLSNEKPHSEKEGRSRFGNFVVSKEGAGIKFEWHSMLPQDATLELSEKEIRSIVSRFKACVKAGNLEKEFLKLFGPGKKKDGETVHEESSWRITWRGLEQSRSALELKFDRPADSKVIASEFGMINPVAASQDEHASMYSVRDLRQGRLNEIKFGKLRVEIGLREQRNEKSLKTRDSYSLVYELSGAKSEYVQAWRDGD